MWLVKKILQKTRVPLQSEVKGGNIPVREMLGLFIWDSPSDGCALGLGAFSCFIRSLFPPAPAARITSFVSSFKSSEAHKWKAEGLRMAVPNESDPQPMTDGLNLPFPQLSVTISGSQLRTAFASQFL